MKVKHLQLTESQNDKWEKIKVDGLNPHELLKQFLNSLYSPMPGVWKMDKENGWW